MGIIALVTEDMEKYYQSTSDSNFFAQIFHASLYAVCILYPTVFFKIKLEQSAVHGLRKSSMPEAEDQQERQLTTKLASMAQPWKIPPIVQELAAGLQEPPGRYVVRDQDRPAAAAAAAMPEPIPIVDLSRLSAADDGGGADGEVAKLRCALQNWGLFLVESFSSIFWLIDPTELIWFQPLSRLLVTELSQDSSPK
jgi:hypothetical protein